MGAAASWPPGLAVPLTPFIGRQGELAEVARLVAANRLVTLVGAGGVGKTRLAVEVAAAVSADLGDGAVVIDLSAAVEPGLLPGLVARALGVEDRAGAGVEERLIRVLAGQQRLLVLDNCEHLRAACAGLAVAVLGACPGVVVLATSRASLGVAGEVTWRVPSLRFPWPQRPPAVAGLAEFEAVALFVARARAVRPGLQIGPGEVGAVTSICFHLDGIPLALELAAARVGALGLAEIAERLTGCFELLAGSGTGPARHQTLRASVQWSYQLLSPPEQVLFRRLAVFAGDWSLEAAEAVCTLPPVAGGQAAALLAGLVDKSLVQADQTPSGSRYRLLEVIGAFARERLADAAEAEEVRARHGEYFADLAERAAPELLGAGQAGWARRLDQDSQNLRAARAWCRQDPARAGTGLRLAAGLWEYWHIRGDLAEGTAWLEDALARGRGPEGARAAALNGLGVLVSLQGQPVRGRDLFTQSADAFRTAGDRPGESRAWTHVGNGRALCGDPSGAAEAFGHGLELARSLGDVWLEAFALFLSGWAATLSGDPVGASTRVTASAQLFDRAGDQRGVGYAQLALGDCLAREGKAVQALAVLREGIGVFEALPERWGLMYGASLLAGVCAALGDWPRAAMLLGILDTLSERTGGQLFPHIQASLDVLETQARDELGPALHAARHAGRVLGRGDQITAALWPADRAPEPATGRGLPLTGREREVAELIAQGLTNRQIGARLFIAERTVDTHVGRILAKLGCTSRAQAAAIVAATAAVTAATVPNDP
jgi:predicted ATPase/DNA-binding CsgD family transcriptional regulator